MGTAFLYGNGGGSNLNFSVKTYAAEEILLADTPRENTIGIVTETAAPKWSFSASEPAELSEGTVWVQRGTKIEAEFDALKKNTLVVYLSGCKQYISGAWQNLIAYIFKSGAWIQFSSEATYLYYEGEQYAEITGGWESVALNYSGGSGSNALTVTSDANGVTLKQEKAGKGGIYKTKNKISLDEFSGVYFTGEIYRDSKYANNIGLVILPEIGSTIEQNAAVNYVAPKGTNTYSDNAIVDVSGLSGEYYFAFYINSTDNKYITLNKLYLK